MDKETKKWAKKELIKEIKEELVKDEEIREELEKLAIAVLDDLISRMEILKDERRREPGEPVVHCDERRRKKYRELFSKKEREFLSLLSSAFVELL